MIHYNFDYSNQIENAGSDLLPSVLKNYIINVFLPALLFHFQF